MQGIVFPASELVPDERMPSIQALSSHSGEVETRMDCWRRREAGLEEELGAHLGHWATWYPALFLEACIQHSTGWVTPYLDGQCIASNEVSELEWVHLQPAALDSSWGFISNL